VNLNFHLMIACIGLAALSLSAATNAPAAAVKSATNTVARSETAKPAGWSWDDLARRAGERADKAKVQFIRAAAKRQQLNADLAWKDPQLRIGENWGNERTRSTLDPRTHGDSEKFTVGARFYIANPFVNRYIRRSGDAQIEALEARAKTEQYAIYCEVKALCLEEERLRREYQRRVETSSIWERIRVSLESRMEKGVIKSPLDAVHAEVAREKARAQADEALLQRRQIRRQISFYTGVSESDLKIRYTPPEPPSTNRDFAVALWQVAFERRPDLVGARAELAAARANVGMAKAAYLPWFDFVEGTYAYSTSSSEAWSGSALKGTLMEGRKSDRNHDWQVRVAISVPVFTWFGGAVSDFNKVEELQDLRVQSLGDSLRNEVDSAMDDYRAADALFVRLSDQGSKFVKRMQTKLEEFSQTSTVKPDDICRAQLELLDYRSFKDAAEYEWISRILILETVSGGPLPYGALKPVK